MDIKRRGTERQRKNQKKELKAPLLDKNPTHFTFPEEDEDDLEFQQQSRQHRKSEVHRKKYAGIDAEEIEQPIVLIIRELIAMGFPSYQVKRLACIHKIQELSEAVAYLTKDEKGFYSHYFTPDTTNKEQCFICREPASVHYQRNPNERTFSNMIITPRNQRRLTQEVRTSSQGPQIYNLFSPSNQSISKEDINENIQQRQLSLPGGLAAVIENEQYCNICYCEMEEGKYLIIEPCKHQFCIDCTISYLNNLIQNRQIQKLICPQFGCGKKLEFKLLEKILSEEQLKKYEGFKQDLEVMIDSKRGYCPNPQCNKITKYNKKKAKKFKCEHCEFQFCGKCQIIWSRHENRTCEDVLAEELGDWYQNSDFQNCPKCRVRTEKTDGCNHIVCIQCRNEWCWICGATCSYAHYLPFNPFGCAGLLFMLLTTIFFFSVGGFVLLGDLNNCCCRINSYAFKRMNIIFKLIFIVIFLTEAALVLSIVVGIGSLLVALAIIPAYFCQFYRIIKIILIWGFKLGDGKIKERVNARKIDNADKV